MMMILASGSNGLTGERIQSVRHPVGLARDMKGYEMKLTAMMMTAAMLTAAPVFAGPSAPCYGQPDNGGYWFRTFATGCTYAVETAGNRDPSAPAADDSSDADSDAGDAGDAGSDAAPQ
jgi:hypothetical protein